MKNRKQVSLKFPWLMTEDGTAEVVRWLVTENEVVEIDQDIMVMLLNNKEFFLPSPVDGTISSFLVGPGDLIEPDQLLAVIEVE